MRTFFGGTFIEKEKLEEAGIKHPIKLEYYKQINEDEINSHKKAKYGIEIIKTEYIPNNLKIETKNIKYVTNDELEENKILNIFLISIPDVLSVFAIIEYSVETIAILSCFEPCCCNIYIKKSANCVKWELIKFTSLSAIDPIALIIFKLIFLI